MRVYGVSFAFLLFTADDFIIRKLDHSPQRIVDFSLCLCGNIDTLFLVTTLAVLCKTHRDNSVIFGIVFEVCIVFTYTHRHV